MRITNYHGLIMEQQHKACLHSIYSCMHCPYVCTQIIQVQVALLSLYV